MNRTSFQNNIVITLGLLISPIAGLTLSFASLSRTGDNRYKHIIISLAFFFIMLYMPPMADLFRHYLVFSAAKDAGISYFTGDSLDLTLPMVMYLFKVFSIPFYYLSPVFLSLSVFLMYRSLDYALTKYSYYNKSITVYIIINVSALLITPIFIIASGLRFGLACFIIIYAIFKYTNGGIGLRTFLFLTLLSALTHFSMFVFLFLPFAIAFFSGSRREAVAYFLTCSVFSVVAPIIIYSIPALNTPYIHAYISGEFSSLSGKNINGIIVYSFQFLPTLLLLIYFMLNENSELSLLRKACTFIIIVTCLSMFSAELFQRFNIIAMFSLYLYFILSMRLKLSGLNNALIYLLLLVITFFYFSFQSVYVFRNQVLLGKMVYSLYEPPIHKLFSVDRDFYRAVKQLNPETGEWVGHEAASE
ncbi:hypothetical protein [Pluralibacter gergoviae]|uniref:hypothetical protein n=1 Tax=Pluralibacter gergoviae TaxID=61647 RepID=UPI00330D2889|nr:hypothetical protein [Pluralibacter gergoviae]